MKRVKHSPDDRYLERVMDSSSAVPMNKSRDETLVTINGTEALVSNMGSDVAVVVTHPWKLVGGSMHNNVVSSVVRFFQSLSVTTLRFNFKASIGRGYSQVEQLRECCSFLLQNANIVSSRGSPKHNEEANNPSTIILIGYSYGALIAGSAMPLIDECIGYCGISTPFGVSHWLTLFTDKHHIDNSTLRPKIPRLLIQGSEDKFTSKESFASRIDSFPKESTTGAVLSGADHFFHGKERIISSAISQWMLSVYPELCGDLTNLKSVKFEIPDHDDDKNGELSSHSLDREDSSNCSFFSW